MKDLVAPSGRKCSSCDDYTPGLRGPGDQDAPSELHQDSTRTAEMTATPDLKDKVFSVITLIFPYLSDRLLCAQLGS